MGKNHTQMEGLFQKAVGNRNLSHQDMDSLPTYANNNV
jgi:hypothetical protein